MQFFHRLRRSALLCFFAGTYFKAAAEGGAIEILNLNIGFAQGKCLIFLGRHRSDHKNIFKIWEKKKESLDFPPHTEHYATESSGNVCSSEVRDEANCVHFVLFLHSVLCVYFSCPVWRLTDVTQFKWPPHPYRYIISSTSADSCTQVSHRCPCLCSLHCHFLLSPIVESQHLWALFCGRCTWITQVYIADLKWLKSKRTYSRSCCFFCFFCVFMNQAFIGRENLRKNLIT